MARKPRVHLPGYTQHVIQRGNNREACFFAEADYAAYREILGNAAGIAACQIHAYVLMTNHVHLLVTPQVHGGLSQLMKAVGQGYCHYFNQQHQRTGSLWEGRYKAEVIDTEHYLLTCSLYIEANPVRAGMAVKPSEYPWSSARWHGLGEPDPVVMDHPLYEALGLTPAERQSAYRALYCVMESRRRAGELAMERGSDRKGRTPANSC